MVIGNPSEFAIESLISEAYESPSLRALGFFLIHLGAKEFGVRSASATLLANSVDEVERRLTDRGQHGGDSFTDYTAQEIATGVHAAVYADVEPHDQFLGQNPEQLRTVLERTKLIWAPDGDAAFDDGSVVLHMDVADRVRLIAFRNRGIRVSEIDEVTEWWLPADKYYGVLARWRDQFLTDWHDHPKKS